MVCFLTKVSLNRINSDETKYRPRLTPNQAPRRHSSNSHKRLVVFHRESGFLVSGPPPMRICGPNKVHVPWKRSRRYQFGVARFHTETAGLGATSGLLENPKGFIAQDRS